MQTEGTRMRFSQVFSQGWKIYTGSATATLPASLLCTALPSVLTTSIAYFAAMSLFRPAFEALREMLQALFIAGPGTRAMEEALERAGEFLRGFPADGVPSLLVGMLGMILVLVPLTLLFGIVLAPIGQGAIAEAQSRMWHGVRIPAKRALAAAGRRAGRLIVLFLCGTAVSLVASLVVNVTLSVLTMLPGVGGAFLVLLYLVQLALSLAIGACMSLAVLVGMNEDKWHFVALYEAAKRLFRDGNFALLYLCYFGIALGVELIVLLMDLYMALLLFFPPVLTGICAAFLQPFATALLTAAYYADRKRQGYAPACGLNDQK
ncbi:MAG: hypothetical protein ACOX83_02000 [Candidatus Spyradocola sp.]|jgi:hypothetical protein